MSRIGKREIELPSGVSVELAGEAVTVKGPKGQLSTPTHPKIVLTRYPRNGKGWQLDPGG